MATATMVLQESGEIKCAAEDPLRLRQYFKLDSEIKLMEETGREKLAKYYRKQNDQIEGFLSPIKPTVTEQHQIEYKIAVYGSFAANCLLFVLQLTAAIITGSLVLFATTADSLMDVSSTIVIIVFGRLADQTNYIKFPTGKEKYKTAGIVVFSTLMATLALQLIVESIKTLIQGQSEIKFDPFTYAIVAVAFISKSILLIYCKTHSDLESVAILAQDHQNDVIFNTSGVILAIIASKTQWWIDPMGAIILAVLICKTWFGVGQEHVLQIVGTTAPTEIHNRLVYLALTHDDRIKQVDTCRAYHSGSKFFVEVDITCPPEMRLDEAHDIGEALQEKFELLPEVDRAFVHLDYETSHKPEHRKLS